MVALCNTCSIIAQGSQQSYNVVQYTLYLQKCVHWLHMYIPNSVLVVGVARLLVGVAEDGVVKSVCPITREWLPHHVHCLKWF